MDGFNNLKGFVDTRDNFRYIFNISEFNKDDLGGFSFKAIFRCYNEETEEYKFDYWITPDAEVTYRNWTDLKCIYQVLVDELGCEVELPESMDEELF